MLHISQHVEYTGYNGYINNIVSFNKNKDSVSEMTTEKDNLINKRAPIWRCA